MIATHGELKGIQLQKSITKTKKEASAYPIRILFWKQVNPKKLGREMKLLYKGSYEAESLLKPSFKKLEMISAN